MGRVAIILICLFMCGCGGGGSRSSFNSGGSGGSYPDPAGLSPLITSREQAHKRGNWTILIYLDADNDLESAGMSNLNQMEKVGSTEDVRIVVQIDRAPGGDSSAGNWTDTRRYLITRDTNSVVVSSIRLDSPPLGELDMADPANLRDFVQQSQSEFPAEHYCLIIWDHGSGWEFLSPSAPPAYKYVVSDNTSHSGMNVDEIQQALSGTNLDVIAFDACLMQQLEVAYELRNVARYMVGSAALEPSPGYDYSALLRRVTGSTSASELCRDIVQCYSQAYPPPQIEITQCAVDLYKIDAVAQAISSYADVLRRLSQQVSGFEAARARSLDYAKSSGGNRSYFDLLDYSSRCASVAGGEANLAFNNLAAAVSSATVAEAHNSDMPHAHGIGIYVPPAGYYDARYDRLQFAANTTWDDWLKASRR
jgi:hypothetical protein